MKIKNSLGMVRAVAFTVAVCFCLNFRVTAQAPLQQGELVLSYEFQAKEGTNASAVAFIPGPNVYITVIAGNPSFPMEVFDPQGKTLASMEVGIDIRGIWYNPETKMLEGNGPGESGWYSRALNAQGIPTGEWTSIKAGQLQPEEQSVLSYITPKKKLVTFYKGSFSFWGRKKPKEKVRYQHGTPGNTNWFIDPTTAAYTGNDAYPVAVLELNAGMVLYFDLKGKYLGATTIDNVDPQITGFRFAFANRRAFIYDKEGRTWRAYKVF
ncbi:MAG: hypothetical protein IPN95_25345 [Bacteroidetes bacterium]|nr:hypothetical protein [Bacteroidota bacterium]